MAERLAADVGYSVSDHFAQGCVCVSNTQLFALSLWHHLLVSSLAQCRSVGVHASQLMPHQVGAFGVLGGICWDRLCQCVQAIGMEMHLLR